MLKQTLLAPAKINLSLSLTGTRSDGYHLLDSVVAPVALFDELDVRFESPARPHTDVTSDHPAVPGGPQNLAFRAVDAFRRLTALPFRIEVQIRKQIPVGSGLGGGSSDAATLLKFLNRALGLPLDLSKLTSLSTQIGADVPFFVVGRLARVRGIGEVVDPLERALEIDLVVCWPGANLPTAQVFAEADRLDATKPPDSLTSRRPDSNIADFVDGHRPISELLVNDLEDAAARICPEVRSLKQELLNLGALGASMTGSGSAIFGICSDAASAERIAAALNRRGLWARPTRTLAASPEAEC